MQDSIPTRGISGRRLSFGEKIWTGSDVDTGPSAGELFGQVSKGFGYWLLMGGLLIGDDDWRRAESCNRCKVRERMGIWKR